jgi:bifunctional DNA-binding transcriptional regulator/antitoxin component of YhaV-PrlF toxin-antitoxin module
MITTVTGKNQVTVPAAIAAVEAIEPGTRLQWSATEREHVLEVRVLPSVAAVAAGLRGRGLRHRQRPGSTVDALVQEREREDTMP